MKNTYFILFLGLWFLFSCSEDEVQPDSSNNSQDITEEIEIDETVNYISSDFDFSTITENDTLNIAYTHDLEGANVILPPHVVIRYYGGCIINGTLTFDNCIIDGELLNYQLEVSGSATLSSTTFNFEKSKWNITEGEVSDEIAITNKKNIQKAIDLSKRLGVTTFNINQLDAYFNVTYDKTDISAISLPSYFTLNMTDNTHIRVQPNNKAGYVLLQMYEVSNVKIVGGKLYGDRDEHDYSSTNSSDGEYTWEDTHEGGSLIDITASNNILVEGSSLRESTGDGMGIGCLGSFTDRGLQIDYQQSIDVTISNCTFDSNRRNGISPGDGVRVTIDNNTFLNSGIDTEKSKGIAPRCAIDVESWWTLDENNNLIRYHTTTDFVISNNTERGGANISFIVACGENVILENNDVEQRMGFNTGRNITIRNNIVSSLIFSGDGKYRAYMENLEVYGNTIKGDFEGEIGILFQSYNTKIFANNIIGKTQGIRIANCGNSEIYENHIESPQDQSITYGIFAFLATINNVDINKNKIFNCNYKPITCDHVNNFDGGENNYVSISNNYLDNELMSIEEVERHVYDSKGIVVH